MYFLPLHAVLSKGVSYARLPAMRPAGSNPGVDAICRLSLLLVLSLSPRGFSPGTSVFPSGYLGGTIKNDRFSYHYKISVGSVSLCR